MSYNTIEDIPKNIQSKLSKSEQEIFLTKYKLSKKVTESEKLSDAWKETDIEIEKKKSSEDIIEGVFEIKKKDESQNLVFGFANVTFDRDGEQIVDSHNHLIDSDELETAAYLYNLAFRESGEMHEGESKGKLIESFVITKEKLDAIGLQKKDDTVSEGWWVGFYVEDDTTYEKIKKGEYSMFSIQGQAILEDT